MSTYVIGDILDRGPHPIKAMQYLMTLPNCTCLVGNHELMALSCMEHIQGEQSYCT